MQTLAHDHIDRRDVLVEGLSKGTELRCISVTKNKKFCFVNMLDGFIYKLFFHYSSFSEFIIILPYSIQWNTDSNSHITFKCKAI